MRTLIDGGTLSTLPDRSRDSAAQSTRVAGKAAAPAPTRLGRARQRKSRGRLHEPVDIASWQRDSHRLRLWRVMDRRVLEIIGVIRFAVLGQVRHPRLDPLPLTRRSPCE